MADDQEQEAAGVLVFVLTGELLLQVVHLLAVQVRVDLNIKPFMSILIIQEWSITLMLIILTDSLENFGHSSDILPGGRLLSLQVIHYDGITQFLPAKYFQMIH